MISGGGTPLCDGQVKRGGTSLGAATHNEICVASITDIVSIDVGDAGGVVILIGYGLLH
ncbi:hypothetical protein DUT67_18540 [Pectobacterium peruviense]|uniref:hypothetical protein n=1 Tax=Pectobacterium peruviense TaxID=2066479 RepID=UPI0016709173|nr:hypothetical protein [Pectobacterium peruviense]